MELSASVKLARTESGLEYFDVNGPQCQAKIYLQGAQITEFIPAGQKNLLWVSQDETYLEGQSIRGGIPICWPWFGVHAEPDWPAHGFARKQVWRAERVEEDDTAIRIVLSLPMASVDRTFWPYESSLTVEFVLSEQLEVRLCNTNTGSETFTLTQALHTYFPTPAIAQTRVDGLQGANFIEFGEGPFVQNEVVTFARETDMVYTQAPEVQIIDTPEGKIAVGREHSSSCVLWNPWIEKSKRLSNFRDDEYHTMLCLEAANVMDDAVTLAPGESHTLTTKISWIE
ncbi:D-hexose-6-phosphate mutarotase [Pseudoalteromonas ardens]|uniref:Putative glucose-6-phosphate 1-epimerase n=1 Tax=Pseudoalteromonas rubra TaxID=43658 RepID=A0A0L0ER10_9GAMM|nr:D-hexose-6-phosphate mutarotase [Pseudoalteromonas sp. R96]KNC66844.1 aldose epimerase [Pseudoalteromonas rubra]MDK1313789.1 D-hexose-6-phosphate mutarotase [Pseudoalteromonas sp. R96]